MTEKALKKTGKLTLTEKDIANAEILAGYGLTLEQISPVIGVSVRTLKRRVRESAEVREALARGRAKIIAKVSETLVRMATSGKVPSATYFFLKTRAGYRETDRMEITGKNGQPIEHKEVNLAEAIKKARLRALNRNCPPNQELAPYKKEEDPDDDAKNKHLGPNGELGSSEGSQNLREEE